ncbi:hypothetical protein [Kitasatospora sp. NPDC058046]|uniref:hypothetical protein n=1 Tax=Kitasatospora sp. NPDC058046 TaxID=3346312 RepID=UPI0036DA99E1
MPAAPGQRAAQHPLRAATATQRALGAALTQGGNEALPPVGVALLDGTYYTVDLSGDVPRLVPSPPLQAIEPHPDPPQPVPQRDAGSALLGPARPPCRADRDEN